ncbi:hypothetical protein CUMW_040520 [Citrus unshiu]|nr:hypothetical protein CUMW_040520 [Citrus unshiu]
MRSERPGRSSTPISGFREGVVGSVAENPPVIILLTRPTELNHRVTFLLELVGGICRHRPAESTHSVAAGDSARLLLFVNVVVFLHRNH